MLGYVNVSMAMSGVGNGDVIDLPMVDELTLARGKINYFVLINYFF